MPMNTNITGAIDIHEMESHNENLFFINTSFSCLCTADHSISFKPIWQPPFISLLEPIDKCHLNGFCLKDGVPKYVTMLGQTDEPLGWRENKKDGGLLMDIQTNEILAQGLSMPHSPRWHQKKLWFLESGKGALSYIDVQSKKITEVVRVPGFTRGIQMVGNLAFIGLSKVRESATFSGLEITKLSKRICGVWVVDIVQGTIISFIEFTKEIDELFAITLLPFKNAKILNQEHELCKVNYMVPQEDLQQVQMPSEDVKIAAPIFEQGIDLFNENKKEDAIVKFKEALNIDQSYLPARLNMAIALGDLGKFDEAKQLLLDVINDDASIAEAYNSLGYLYFKQQDLKEAENYFIKAIEINPDYTQAKTSLEVLRTQYNV